MVLKISRDEEKEPPRTGFALFLTVFPSIMLPMFMGVIDQTIVATALPAIAGDLGDVDLLSWIVVSYLVTATVASLVYGKLGDHFGRRRLMFVALCVFMVASVLCALAPSANMLVAARALQGMGGGGLLTLSQALVGETIPPLDRARYQGYLAAVGVTASSFGPVAGGLLTEQLGWQSIFLINVPLSIAALVLTFRLPVRPGTGGPFRFDFPGLVLIAVSVGSVLSLVQLARRMDSASLPSAGILLGLAIAGSLILFVHEKRIPNPLLPLALFRNPVIAGADALAAMFGATLISLLTFLPIYYRVIYGASPAEIGLLLLPMTMGTGIGSLLTGQIISRTGRTAIVPSLGLIVVVVLILMLAFWSPYLTRYQISAILGVNAIFLGTVMSVVQLSVQIAAGTSVLGSAAATVQFSRTLGSALGTAIVGGVLFGYLAATDQGAMSVFVSLLQEGGGSLASLSDLQREVIRMELLGAFRAAFVTTAGFAICGAAIAWTLPLRRL